MNIDTHGSAGKGWIGVDLDGTLALYDGWKGADHIGAPIPLVMIRVKGWLLSGREVKIMTARVSPAKPDAQQCRGYIMKWLEDNGLPPLEVTHEKDHMMLELWDDRCVQVVPNTGKRADEAPAEKYHELLFAVSSVHPGETRHETALRYIREAEARELPNGDVCDCGRVGEPLQEIGKGTFLPDLEEARRKREGMKQ